MNREVHVRICEGLGVKFPGPTRHSRHWPPSDKYGGNTLGSGRLVDHTPITQVQLSPQSGLLDFRCKRCGQCSALSVCLPLGYASGLSSFGQSVE